MRRKLMGTFVAVAVLLIPALLLAEGTKVRYYTYRSQTQAVKSAPVSTQSSVTVAASRTSNPTVLYTYSRIRWAEPRSVPVKYSCSRFSYHYRPRYRRYWRRRAYYVDPWYYWPYYLPVSYYGYPHYPIIGYRRIRPRVWVPSGYVRLGIGGHAGGSP